MSQLSLKKQRKAGTVEDATVIQWRALSAAQEALYAAGEEDDISGVLKAVHAITQGSAAYAKLVETGELEARLAELERMLEERHHQNGRAYA